MILRIRLIEILELLSDEISGKILETPKQNDQFVSNVISIFLEIHKRHSDVLDILVYSCEGSSIENPAELVTRLLAEKMETLISMYAVKNNMNLDTQFLAEILCRGLVDNFIKILYKFDDDESRRIHMIQITQIYTQLFISDLLNERKMLSCSFYCLANLMRKYKKV